MSDAAGAFSGTRLAPFPAAIWQLVRLVCNIAADQKRCRTTVTGRGLGMQLVELAGESADDGSSGRRAHLLAV